MSDPGKGPADYLDLGNWNAICYRCGHKRKAGEMWKQWQGFWVCPKHWEPRQPQDFARNVPDIQAPPWIQPPPTDEFVTFCAPNGTTGIIGFAVVDCAIIEYISPAFDPNVT